MLKKKGAIEKEMVFFSIFLALILVIGLLIFFSFFSNSQEKPVKTISNPSLNLTLEEAKAKFDESFVFYLLYTIEAQELHNPPFSKEQPKFKVVVDSKEFYIKIVNGEIIVSKEVVNGEDIVIITSVEESIKMMSDKNYIQESFSSGKSRVELVSDKITLFKKGYLNLYTKLTGKQL
jgi:hypothetical protein